MNNFKKMCFIGISIVVINLCLTDMVEKNARKKVVIERERKEQENIIKEEEVKLQQEILSNNKESIQFSKEEIELMEKERKLLEEKKYKESVKEINNKIKMIDSVYLDDNNYEINYNQNDQNITINFSNFNGRFPDVRLNSCVAIVQDIYANIKNYLESKNIKNIIFNQIKDSKINYTYTFNMEKMKVNEFDKVKSDTIHYIRSMDDIDRLFDK